MASGKPTSAVERAFELARLGEVKTIHQIRQRLAREGYDQDLIYGRTLAKQLNDAIREAGSNPLTHGNQAANE